ncbi:MAG: hypothetical protein GY851_21305 [bacterium]|nr:hypothetical protein [bacterium]
MKMLTLTVALVLGVALTGHAEFKLEDDGKALTVVEDGKPVLTYKYARVDPPENVSKERYWRMSYVHPLYGLDGDVLTQDFPDDHRHHRGIFWAWPHCSVGDRRMDTWAIDKVRELFDEWLVRETTEGFARLGVQNLWKFDGEDVAQVRERVFITVYPADEAGRAVDFVLQFQNVSNEVVTFLGATDIDKKVDAKEAKGYGGFCVRPDKGRKPLSFTSAMGPQKDDVLSLDTPWVDVSMPIKPEGASSGFAIFQHPDNPGYPHPGWILRNYGFLGASWPRNDPYTLQPGEYVELRYRLYVHRGGADEGKVADRFQTFLDEAK